MLSEMCYAFSGYLVNIMYKNEHLFKYLVRIWNKVKNAVKLNC